MNSVGSCSVETKQATERHQREPLFRSVLRRTRGTSGPSSAGISRREVVYSPAILVSEIFPDSSDKPTEKVFGHEKQLVPRWPCLIIIIIFFFLWLMAPTGIVYTRLHWRFTLSRREYGRLGGVRGLSARLQCVPAPCGFRQGLGARLVRLPHR